MKNKIIPNIYGKQENITRKEIDDVLSKETIPHNVALKTMANSFDDEALEGFQTMQVKTLILNELDEKLSKQFRSNQFGYFDRFFSVLWALGFLLTIALGKIYNNEDKLETKVAEIAQYNSTQPVKSDLYSAERFKIQDIVPIASQITSPEKQVTKNQQSQNVPERENFEVFRMQENVAIGLDSEIAKTNIRHPKAQEIALSNFIFIDYRGIRRKVIKPMKSNFTGVSANLENENTADLFLPETDLSTEIAYHDYLEATALLMNKGNFEKSIKRFEIILKQFPDDHNALFYIGFCYFQLQQFAESLKFLNQLKQPIWGNFEEETQWYKAKCYFELGQRNQFIKEANEIIQKNGFYSTQAKALMKSKP